MEMSRKTRIENDFASPSDLHYHYTPASAGTDEEQLTVLQQDVRIANAYAATVILPPVSECRGKTFTISVNSATAAITLTDYGNSVSDSRNWEGDYTLSASEDRIVLKSTGFEWAVIENQIA